MIKPLTSLRFFFALCVFLSHLSFLRNNQTYENLFDNYFSEGFLGVSFFFILSGFILALNYREKFKNKTITLKKFYIARFARIYPLYFFTMLASIPIVFTGYKILFSNLLLFQSYIPHQKYFFAYNAPSWSISDEMFFYLLFPVLIVISYKFKTIFKVLLAVAFVLVVILLNNLLPEEKKHYWLYISPFVRVFDFILGILLFDVCLYLKKSKTKFTQSFNRFSEIAAFGVLLIFFLCEDYLSISYRYSIYYWLPMCMIIMISAKNFFSQSKETFLLKVISWKWFVYLGEISFGFYLIHYLVIIYLNKYNGFLGVRLEGFSLALVMFIITLITSIFAYEKIEKPFNRKIKDLFS